MPALGSRSLGPVRLVTFVSPVGAPGPSRAGHGRTKDTRRLLRRGRYPESGAACQPETALLRPGDLYGRARATTYSDPAHSTAPPRLLRAAELRHGPSRAD